MVVLISPELVVWVVYKVISGALSFPHVFGAAGETFVFLCGKGGSVGPVHVCTAVLRRVKTRVLSCFVLRY